ncbi:hypothetical protein [Sphingobium sp.]|uniref:hypothetical protein n=1 Tax=Sphingobium sp. TaxID=1912891 RepID=UPI003B3BBB2D
MKAIHVTAQSDGRIAIAELPLPCERRTGVGDVEGYRRQARGEEPISNNYGPNPADHLRSITLADGRFTELATQPGSLLHFIIGGDLILMPDTPLALTLEPGDVMLVDGNAAPQIVIDARNEGRIVQLGVPSDWPGDDAKVLDSGTINPRGDHAPNFKRIYTGDREKAFFTEFPEIFGHPVGQWSAPRRVTGFRMLTWVDGFVDFHPNVVNQMGIILAGQLDLEVGGDGRREAFRPGDVCLTEDITGEGHRNFASGVMHVTTIVIPDDQLWPWSRA